MHGKQSEATVDTNCAIFKGLDNKVSVARYHSLAALEKGFPECLEVVAKTDDNEIMAVKHKEYHIYGLQFHPESIMTKDGMKMLENFFIL